LQKLRDLRLETVFDVERSNAYARVRLTERFPVNCRAKGRLMKSRIRMASILIVALAVAGADSKAQTAPQKITVESPALKHDQPMPRDYTPDGRNISPPLTWSNVPAGTREFAVILEDPDAGNPPPYVHWLIYKIPGTAKGLPENIPIDPATPMPADLSGAIQGSNGFRRNLYRGPAPPPGKPHHYHFIVYALDQPLNVTPGLTRPQLLEAMKGHVIGQGELVATYIRK
jgi:Raf kinase inhibitor-like YbhB/YbcL family protein